MRLLPSTCCPGEPAAGGAELVGIDPETNFATVSIPMNEGGLFQNREMLRNGLSGNIPVVCELAGRHGSALGKNL